ncbi:hypothetical protein [Mesorhizobium sp.]|uniref:hypothetical protein n=1 Tax=Mesorhizobium sp. TaxID=1871066 RepID=UPI0025C30463|nr:hypothetical protein [Mesorhizobium sp.]
MSFLSPWRISFGFSVFLLSFTGCETHAQQAHNAGKVPLRRLAARHSDFVGSLEIILRRAALMLRNVSGVPLEPATEDALNSIAAEMNIGRSDLIQIVLREWLETNAYLPVREIDEESETDGSA